MATSEAQVAQLQGIIDSHALMLTLQGDFENAGGLTVLNSPVASVFIASDAIKIVMQDGALIAGYAGMRPKINSPTEAAADFVIQGPKDHSIDGLVNLFGIESPRLTSSMAIGQYVSELF